MGGVSWTGTLAASRRAGGVSLHWAYSPSEIQILTSPDGSNFFEASCWLQASQKDASYTEHIAFEQAVPVRSLTVLMRGPRSWNYFGLNGIALLTEPGPIMLERYDRRGRREMYCEHKWRSFFRS